MNEFYAESFMIACEKGILDLFKVILMKLKEW